MSDLDTKLRELVIYPIHEVIDKHGRGQYRLADEDIAQIKQAFQEAGYGKFEKVAGFDLPPSDTDDVALIDVLPTLTGQEWYDRFEKELSITGLGEAATKLLKSQILEAARRAAGLSK